MTKKRYTKADMDEVLDHPELTDAQLMSARPFSEVFPGLAATIRSGDSQETSLAKGVSVHLDADVAERLRQGGAGWQRRANDILRKALELPPPDPRD